MLCQDFMEEDQVGDQDRDGDQDQAGDQDRDGAQGQDQDGARAGVELAAHLLVDY